jgi:hypothetical protein
MEDRAEASKKVKSPIDVTELGILIDVISEPKKAPCIGLKPLAIEVTPSGIRTAPVQERPLVTTPLVIV